ncbi:transglycosylase SLT domain-containing protein [Spectribacter hydrogenooxidans]|uniref:Transglycosylase SLT domain-containing protein n=1 Tax=Spectribacter hydrogenoxidans TaxID=3075608 RepID=A0ABU3BY56_9GAMM|nr:transglycosylase SLT domain-containing protein [Salinisphaera sp. W335]MDT0634239.1 transglycosylase SLT domain-containing protein [Salinisphaera sp. W335]
MPLWPWILSLCLWLSACAVAPPRQPDNLCAIFHEKDGWYDDAHAAEKRWGTPIPVQMAIIFQESAYQQDVRPPRTRLLWVIPWTRPSSAYGYTQALDSTWAWYQRDSGNSWADRDDFEDAVDFVAWYVNQSHRQIGIARNDAYSQYLAYHEGQNGFKRRTWANKKWLINVAYRVSARADRYTRQLAGCREDLESDGWWFFW